MWLNKRGVRVKHKEAALKGVKAEEMGAAEGVAMVLVAIEEAKSCMGEGTEESARNKTSSALKALNVEVSAERTKIVCTKRK